MSFRIVAILSLFPISSSFSEEPQNPGKYLVSLFDTQIKTQEALNKFTDFKNWPQLQEVLLEDLMWPYLGALETEPPDLTETRFSLLGNPLTATRGLFEILDHLFVPKENWIKNQRNLQAIVLKILSGAAFSRIYERVLKNLNHAPFPSMIPAHLLPSGVREIHPLAFTVREGFGSVLSVSDVKSSLRQRGNYLSERLLTHHFLMHDFQRVLSWFENRGPITLGDLEQFGVYDSTMAERRKELENAEILSYALYLSSLVEAWRCDVKTKCNNDLVVFLDDHLFGWNDFIFELYPEGERPRIAFIDDQEAESLVKLVQLQILDLGHPKLSDEERRKFSNQLAASVLSDASLMKASITDYQESWKFLSNAMRHAYQNRSHLKNSHTLVGFKSFLEAFERQFYKRTSLNKVKLKIHDIEWMNTAVQFAVFFENMYLFEYAGDKKPDLFHPKMIALRMQGGALGQACAFMTQLGGRATKTY